MASSSRSLAATHPVADTLRLAAFGLGTAAALSALMMTTAKADTDDWTVTLGAGAAVGADYEGSDDVEVMPLPLVHISWRDTVSLSTMGTPGLSVRLVNVTGSKPQTGLAVHASVGYYGGRDQDDNDALKGLGDMEGGAVLGLSAEYTYHAFGAGLALNQDVSGDREGLEVEASLSYTIQPFTPATRITFSPSLTWADGDYMDNTYGISASQAAASQRGYAPYAASSGFKDMGFGVNVHHSLNANVSIMGGVSYTRLLGDATDSPLVDQEGNANQFSAMLGAAYTF